MHYRNLIFNILVILSSLRADTSNVLYTDVSVGGTIYNFLASGAGDILTGEVFTTSIFLSQKKDISLCLMMDSKVYIVKRRRFDFFLDSNRSLTLGRVSIHGISPKTYLQSKNIEGNIYCCDIAVGVSKYINNTSRISKGYEYHTRSIVAIGWNLAAKILSVHSDDLPSFEYYYDDAGPSNTKLNNLYISEMRTKGLAIGARFKFLHHAGEVATLLDLEAGTTIFGRSAYRVEGKGAELRVASSPPGIVRTFDLINPNHIKTYYCGGIVTKAIFSILYKNSDTSSGFGVKISIDYSNISERLSHDVVRDATYSDYAGPLALSEQNKGERLKNVCSNNFTVSIEVLFGICDNLVRSDIFM